MATAFTLDLGNTRAKLLAWGETAVGLGDPIDLLELPWEEAVPARLAAFASGRAAGAERAPAAVASVVDEARTLAVLAALEDAGLEPRRAPDPGLENATRTPETVGLDRLYAARGAVERVGGSVIVVDAGTALTVDAVEARAGARPRFLGGAIAPGPRLLAQSLAREAARLPLVEPAVDAPALGRDTPAAIRAGVGVGFRGAAAWLVRAVALEAGLEGAPVVATGGAHAFLPPGWPVDPWLVHRGLLAAVRGAGAARGRP